MHHSELEKGIEYFEDKWSPDQGDPGAKYAALRSKGDQYWLHLERLDEDQLMTEIIDGFLNTKTWNCRIPTRDFKNWIEVRAGLKNAVDQLPDYYVALDGFKIEDIDFQRRSIRSRVNHIYSRFLQIKGFGPTAASKLMHMALPNLFVMCDSGILQRYCIPKEKLPELKETEKSYVAFLILMQENVRHVIESHPQGPDNPRPGIIGKIKAQHNGLPLPRLLDMANMAVRDCEQAICIECMKRAKVRWTKLGLTPDNNSGEQ